MVSDTELKNLIENLKVNYGDKFTLTRDMYGLWMRSFKNCNPKWLKKAVETYILTNEFAPTIASINKLYTEVAERRKEESRIIMSCFEDARQTYPKIEPDVRKKLKLEYIEFIKGYPSEKQVIIANRFYRTCVNDLLETERHNLERITFDDYARNYFKEHRYDGD
jgi:hypothetical protein